MRKLSAFGSFALGTLVLFQNCSPARFTSSSSTLPISMSAERQNQDQEPLDDGDGIGTNDSPVDADEALTTNDPTVDISEGLGTGEPSIDNMVNPIINIIGKVDPSVNARGIYYVHTNIVDQFIEKLVYRSLNENPDACRLNWSFRVSILNASRARGISLPYCNGFIRARTIENKNAGSCTPKSKNNTYFNISVPALDIVSIARTHEIDSDCICFKRFKINLVGQVFGHEVRAFIPQSECAQYFSEYQ